MDSLLRPRLLPASLVLRLIILVRQYLSTADAGPRGKKGVPALWNIDARARKLLDEIKDFQQRAKVHDAHHS